MNEAYAKWIAANVEGDGYGQCATVAPKMVSVFPELELRRGLYDCPMWGLRQHCWCRVKGTTVIVDPTGAQHPSGSHFPANDAFYVDLTDASEDEIAARVPTGVCMDCGEPVFHGKTFCSDACQRATNAYLMNG